MSADLVRREPRDPLEAVQDVVLDAVSSLHTKRLYRTALTGFFAWYREAGSPGLNKAAVQRYRAYLESGNLAPSSINVRLSAVRKLATEAADNGWVPPDIAAGIARVKGVRRQGVRAGNWLTAEEAGALLHLPDPGTPKGLRDRAILGFLVGCGLRRAELASLEVGSIQMRDSRWVIPDLAGKGNRIRTVPVPAWVKNLLDRWTAAAGIFAGPLFRPVHKGGLVGGDAITEDGIWNVVREYGARMGKPDLAPHDLRRTCAKLCRASGGDLEQIQLLLGHASIQTTERYLGTRQDLVRAVNDNLPIEV